MNRTSVTEIANGQQQACKTKPPTKRINGTNPVQKHAGYIQVFKVINLRLQRQTVWSPNQMSRNVPKVFPKLHTNSIPLLLCSVTVIRPTVNGASGMSNGRPLIDGKGCVCNGLNYIIAWKTKSHTETGLDQSRAVLEQGRTTLLAWSISISIYYLPSRYFLFSVQNLCV